MNERLLELAQESGFYVYNGVISPPSTSDMTTDKMKVFLELIVEECANVCMEMAAKCAGLENDGALARDCASLIKKDFGVYDD
jgi:hypothetical protein